MDITLYIVICIGMLYSTFDSSGLKAERESASEAI